MGDQAIIRSVRDGDIDAFGLLMDKYMRKIRASIALNSPVAHLIDEIAHEAFVFAFHNIDKFEVGTSFVAWLQAIANNLLRREIQRYSREQANQLRHAERRILERSQTVPPRNAPKELGHLEDCLRQIPEKVRKLMDLRYKYSYTSEKIAGKCQKSSAWVRTTLCRVRKQLKNCVEHKLAFELNE